LIKREALCIERLISRKRRSEKPLSLGREPTQTAPVGKRVGKGRETVGFLRKRGASYQP
jgi:hypothetical protein